jgi:proteasome lid subunit RPN8/RPN11
MVMVLEDSMVREIARIGELRKPNEACGILLPYKVKQHQVIELPNRSKTPHDEVMMMGEDIVLELEMLFGDYDKLPEGFAEQLTFWHTHPGGNLGPSTYDLKHRPKLGKSLVVTLSDPPQATWF